MKTYDYSEDILNVLLNKGIIDEELYEKCHYPKYIQSLPYDLRTNDMDKLGEIIDATISGIRKTSNNILQTTEDIADNEFYLEKKTETLKENMDRSEGNFENLLEAMGNYKGNELNTYNSLQKLIEDYGKIMPKVFERYREYLNKNPTERLKQQIYDDEEELKKIANKFGSVISSRSSFETSMPMDDSSIIKASQRIYDNTIGAVTNFENCVNTEKYLDNRRKEQDSEYRKLEDYRSHLNAVDNKLNNIKNKSDVDVNQVEILQEYIKQSNETFNL